MADSKDGKLLPLTPANLQDTEESEDMEPEYDTQSTDDTIKVDSDDSQPSPKRNKEKTSNTQREPYRCNKCQQIKKGHKCTGSPKQTRNPFYSDDSISTIQETKVIQIPPDPLPTVIPTANTLVETSSFPTDVSLGWFDLTINSITSLHKNLARLPAAEWEHLPMLVDHLDSTSQYFKTMKEEYEIVTRISKDPSTQLLGKRSVSILRDFNQGILDANPEDLAAEPARKQPTLDI